MLVEHIMARARERLVVIGVDASISDAAVLMRAPETDLVVVCDGKTMAGVVTKGDIVRLVAGREVNPHGALADLMTREIVTCRADDRLLDVWSAMSDHRFSRVPVLDDSRRAIGVVYARDALQALLRDAEHEEEVLRAYVQGVGYH